MRTTSRILCSIVFAAAGLTVQLAHAQDGGKMDTIIEQRFNAANTTHDGHLTKEQAQKGMPRVYKNWDKIDTANAGFVTLQQIKDSMKEAQGSKK
jgi:hypothetical protein